jgi:hypothetical protein
MPTCQLCNAEQSASEFYADRRYRLGLNPRCKACLKAKWAESTAERRRKYGRPRTERDNKSQRERRRRGGAALRERRAREMRLWRYRQKAREYLETGLWPFSIDHYFRSDEHRKEWEEALAAVKGA